MDEEAAEDGELAEDDLLNYYGWADPVEPVIVRLSTQFVLDGLATFDLNIYK